MKTLFICRNGAIENHQNEEYDEIIYVPDNPDATNIDLNAKKIMDAIHKLHTEDDSEDRKIVISIDAALPICICVQYMKQNMVSEGIEIELPQQVKITNFVNKK